MRVRAVGETSDSSLTILYAYLLSCRIKENYDLNKILDGEIEGCIQAMISADQQERLKELADGMMVQA